MLVAAGGEGGVSGLVAAAPSSGGPGVGEGGWGGGGLPGIGYTTSTSSQPEPGIWRLPGMEGGEGGLV